MSRSITFNGITRSIPGGISRVQAAALNQVGISASGALGLIGESDGGAPGAVSGLVSLRDPSQAISLFKSGPLVDAINLAFQSSGDPQVPGGAAEVVVYKTNQSTRSIVQLPSLTTFLFNTTAVASGSTTTAVHVAATLVASALIDRWVNVTIAALPGSPTFLRRIVSNTTTTLTVTPALPAVVADADVVHILASTINVFSRDYGSHTATVTVDLDYESVDDTHQVITSFGGNTQLSPSLGGITRNYLHVLYAGGPLAVAETTVTGGSTASVVNVALTLSSAAHANRTFVLKDSSGNIKAYSKITTNSTTSITLATALSAAPLVGDLVDILSVTDAQGGFTGAAGVATAFATTITGVAGDNLAITITNGMTVKQLQSAINLNTNYIATIPSQINGDVELASQFDFSSATINMQTSFSGTVATSGFRQNLKEVVAWINSNAVDITAVRSAGDPLDGGTGNITDYLAPFTLYGGVRGISANSNFQSGFDKMLTRPIDEVVPLIDQDLVNESNSSTATWAVVSQQLLSHVIAARGSAGLERGGWIGFRGTKAQVIAAANGINDEDVQLTPQNPSIVDSTFNLTVKGPREQAVMGASMRLGVNEIGLPLTNKFLRVSGITQDSSWDPANVTDATDLINAGVMFAVNVPGKGVRWVRDLTTWVRDDNLAYAEGSIRDIIRHVVFNLRTQIDARFTGQKATPATIAAIKTFAVTILEVFRQDNLIVDSTDPATGTTIRAYHNLKVFSSGDVATLNVGIFPVPGLNFELEDIFLSIPSQSA